MKFKSLFLFSILIPTLSFAEKTYQCPSNPNFQFSFAMITGQDTPGGWPALDCVYSSPSDPKQPVCYGYPVDKTVQFKAAPGSKWSGFGCYGTQAECQFVGSEQITNGSWGFPDCHFLSENGAG